MQFFDPKCWVRVSKANKSTLQENTLLCLRGKRQEVRKRIRALKKARVLRWDLK